MLISKGDSNLKALTWILWELLSLATHDHSSNMMGVLPMVHLIQMCEGILGEPHIFHQECGSRQGACHGGDSCRLTCPCMFKVFTLKRRQ